MIEPGETYSSPNYGRKITVLSIDKETAESYTLDILWIEPDDESPTVLDTLVVSKQDAARWVKVAY
jgi:hypothetical protein